MAARGLRLAGWVANRMDPSMLAYDENMASLARRLPAPMLAELPYQPEMGLDQVADLFSPKRLDGLLRGT